MDGFHENPDHNRYFVAFVTSDGEPGHTDTHLRHAIRNGDDVKAVEALIGESTGRRVVVTNFRRFDSD